MIEDIRTPSENRRRPSSNRREDFGCGPLTPATVRHACRVVVLLWLLAGATPGIVVAQDTFTLAESIETAKERSLQAEVDRQNIRERSFALRHAKAETLPSVNVSSDYERLLRTHTLKNSLDISWDLSALAKGTVASHELLLRAVEQRQTGSESLLVYQVKTGYYQLMLLKERLRVLRKGVELLQGHRSKTEHFVVLGLRQRSALSRVDDRLGTIENEIVLVQGKTDRAHAALLQLLNLPPSSGKRFAPCDKDLAPLPDLSRVMTDALCNAPEIRRLVLVRQACLETVHSPWLDMLPTVSIGVGYQQEWPVANDGSDLHVVMSIPIADMGRARSNNQRNAALAAGKAAEIERKRKDIADHIRLLYKDARLDEMLYAARKKNHAHRLETLTLANAEYERGLLSESELIDTQKELVDAAFAIEEAFCDYMTAVAAIEYYQGAVK